MNTRRIPELYQSSCEQCNNYIVLSPAMNISECNECGNLIKVPPKSQLVNSAEFVRIKEDSLKYEPDELDLLEDFAEEIRSTLNKLDEEFEPLRDESSICLPSQDLGVAISAAQPFIANGKLSMQQMDFVLSALEYELQNPDLELVRFPPPRLERLEVAEIGGYAFLLILGPSPAILFSEKSENRGMLLSIVVDFLLEIFEFLVILIAGVKPTLRKLKEGFGKLVRKVVENKKFKAIIKKIIETIQRIKEGSKRIKELYEYIRELFIAIYRDLGEMAFEALEITLKGILTVWQIFWAVLRWIARGISAGAALLLELLEWALSAALKLRNIKAEPPPEENGSSNEKVA